MNRVFMRIALFFCLCYFVGFGHGQKLELRDFLFVKHYLKEFHYLSPLKTGNHDLKTGLELFQRFMHLPVTGKIDAKTMTEMNKPRCGFPDIEEDEDTVSPSGKSKRFAVAPTAWKKTILTYGISNTAKDLTKAKVKDIMAKAFKLWSDNSVLTFNFVADVTKADIKISFGAKQHGSCLYVFDGPGQILGHAFYPNNSAIHFDNDETFTDGVSTGKNLLAVAVHEIGHVIGIGHASEKGSVMYPEYGGYNPSLSLHSDDINAVAYLYGGGTVEPSQTTCVDSFKDCPNYSTYCTLPATKTHCPLTCNVCSSVGGQVSSNCADIYSSQTCSSYKALGICSSPYIKPKCAKTCAFC